MTREGDPQGREPQALLAAADFTNARVLEVGCGYGRLTFRYAKATPFVVGIDTQPAEVLRAAQSSPSELAGHTRFLVSSAAALPFRDETFAIALLASSL